MTRRKGWPCPGGNSGVQQYSLRFWSCNTETVNLMPPVPFNMKLVRVSSDKSRGSTRAVSLSQAVARLQQPEHPLPSTQPSKTLRRAQSPSPNFRRTRCSCHRSAAAAATAWASGGNRLGAGGRAGRSSPSLSTYLGMQQGMPLRMRCRSSFVD